MSLIDPRDNPIPDFAKPRPLIALGLCLSLAWTGPALATLHFAAIPNDNLTGIDPNTAVSADLNGDGKADLITANGNGTISVMLGKGDGTFQAKVDTAEIGSQGLAAADFNRDGHLDLATTTIVFNNNVLESKVYVLIGNGDGTFQNYSSYSAQYEGRIAAADLNGDGFVDLATIGYSYGVAGAGVSVLLNTGGSGFSNNYNYAYPKINSSASIIAADFNQDGRADIAIGDNHTISILPGNGDGSLGSATSYNKPYSNYISTDLATADFNGDGRPDLAVPGLVLLGNGLGGFTQQSYSVTPYFNGIVVTDLNGDGKPDIATANYGGNALSVVLGNGDGTFKPNVDYPGISATTVAAADFNGDQHSDLVTIHSRDNTYSLFLSDGNGGLVSPGNRRGVYNIGAASSYPPHEVVADLNGDGFLDIATVVQPNGEKNVSVLNGKGNGVFASQAQHYPVGRDVLQIATLASGDLNRDGRLDLLPSYSNLGHFTALAFGSL